MIVILVIGVIIDSLFFAHRRALDPQALRLRRRSDHEVQMSTMQLAFRMRRVVAETTNDPWGELRACRTTSAVAASADPIPATSGRGPGPVLLRSQESS